MIGFDLDGVIIPDCDNMPNVGNVGEFYELAAMNMQPLFQPGSESVIITARYQRYTPLTIAWVNRYINPLPRRVYHDRTTESAAGYKSTILNNDHTISVYVESDLEIVEALKRTVRTSCKIVHFSTWVAEQLSELERKQRYF
jgi:hypothetical protein